LLDPTGPQDVETAVPHPTESLPELSPDQPSAGSGLARAAAVLAVGNVASRVMGMARETVKANLFGASGLLSAFEIAAYVPTSLFDLIIGGMVNSALVPVFSEYAAKAKREELWRLLSTVLSVATVALLLVVGLVELLAPQIAWLVGANEFDDPELTAVAIRLMRLAAPAVFFLSIASILTGLLYALKRFTLPAFIGAVFNGTIVMVALLRPHEIDSLVWGLLLGSLLQILLQLPALRDGRIRWNFHWRHPAIRRILRLYAPIVAGLVVTQLAVALSYNLATRTGDESITYMRYATTLYQFPLGLVVTALSIAILPTLSHQALGQLATFKRTLAEGIRLVVVLILPATAGLFALAVPIVALLFEHGNFLPENTATTALVLRVYLFGMPFAAVDQMLVFACYARKDTWRPALVGVLSVVVYSLTAVTLLNPLGLLSLMVADAVKHMVHMLMMLFVIQRHIGGLPDQGIMPAVLKSIVAALLTGGLAYLVAHFLMGYLPLIGLVNKLLIVSGSGLAGLLAFVLLVRLLNIKDARALPGLLRRKKNS
jgi:putative peptidoglycan lipid II flippase